MAENKAVKKEEKKEENPLGKPRRELYLEIEEPGVGVESFYFWILRFIASTPPSGISRDDFKYKIDKIKDVFAASETGAYFGSIEQRKGLQQEKVSQYMATLGRMTRDLFQMIRELRIIDERLDYYEKSEQRRDKQGRKIEGWEDAEISLKSIWIDLVEGGSKNPTSVLGLGSQVGFVILPDLFFTIHPEKIKDIEREVNTLGSAEKGGINRKVREVLRRKLWQYMEWKEKTGKEIKQRKSFVTKFLRQHYNVMRMYINWLKPYLRNIKRLQGSQENYPEVVAAFDTSKIELEILAKKVKEKGKQTYYPCLLIKFDYTAIPTMAYQQEFQRGAVHTGLSKIFFECYALTDKQINDYKKKIEDEDLELISSVYESMESLKDDLKKYLEEEGEKWFKEEEVKKEEEKNILTAFIFGVKDSFKNLSDGFKKTFTIKLKSEEDKKESHWTIQFEKKEAEDEADLGLWILYDVFKKAHRMITW